MNTFRITILIICFFSSLGLLVGQESIDGTIDFQTDPAKKYSIYIPSDYDVNVSNALMVGLHPLNTNRWDAESWRDTLIVFAESNSLILAVPDGGSDGAIDDPIDTAFTSLLIDSMSVWFNINENQKYLMGFSWGGKTVYSYGLRRVDEFAGFIPIGAAISGASEIQGLTPNAQDENWYIVHGTNDSPNTRYTPAVNLLTEAGACLESNLLEGVGHTIDFPDRNEILSTAFAYVRDNACATSSTEKIDEKYNFKAIPNPSHSTFTLSDEAANSKVTCFDTQGKVINYLQQGNEIQLDTKFSGLLFIQIDNENQKEVIKHFVMK